MRVCRGPWDGLGDVLELDLVEVGARGDEVRDEAVQVLLFERGRA